MSRLQMQVNGRAVDLDVPESRFLSEVLREDLGLTGTKIGCNEAECGICTVLVNGTPVVSCTYPAFKAAGCRVETIEGLSTGEDLHPLQQAFLDHGAVQCGICTPGMIMTSKALLDEKQAAGQLPDEDDIKTALKGYLLPLHRLSECHQCNQAGIRSGRFALYPGNNCCRLRGWQGATQSGRTGQDSRPGKIYR